MEEIVKDLKTMDSNEIDEYQTLSNKFQDIIDKLSNM